MKLTERDLPKLALPIVITLALCGTAGLMAWWTQNDAEQAGRERHRAAEAKSRIDMRLRQFHSEELDLKTRLQTLQTMQASGMLGDEKRLDWIELLADLQRELRLPEMKYEFGAQIPLDSELKTLWRSSTQHLELHLLHEADLLTFLARLAAQAPALIIARCCQLAPKPADVGSSVAVAQLIAQCELQWLSLQLAS